MFDNQDDSQVCVEGILNARVNYEMNTTKITCLSENYTLHRKVNGEEYTDNFM